VRSKEESGYVMEKTGEEYTMAAKGGFKFVLDGKPKKKIPCNKCTFKAKLTETYEGLVGDHVHVRGIYKCFSGHTQDKILKIHLLEDTGSGDEKSGNVKGIPRRKREESSGGHTERVSLKP